MYKSKRTDTSEQPQGTQHPYRDTALKLLAAAFLILLLILFSRSGVDFVYKGF